MSLKITDLNGFKVGGVLNTSVTVVYVRALPNTQQENLKNNGEQIEINTAVNVTINGGRFETQIKVEGILPIYWLSYSINSTTMDDKYLDIEVDLRAKIVEANPQWEGKIEIINVPN